MLFGYNGFKWYFLKVVLNSGAREMAQTVKTVVVKVAQLSSVSLASWLAVKKFSYTILCFLLGSHPILLQEWGGPFIDSKHGDIVIEVRIDNLNFDLKKTDLNGYLS